MRDHIARIISDCPDTAINQVGDLWQVRVERHCDTGKNGIAVATRLMNLWRWDKSERQPDYHANRDARVIEPPVPPTDYDAIIASLKAQLVKAQAKTAFEPHAEPEPVEMPDFLKAPEAPPAELADLFDPADTVPESNEKLLVRLREVLGLIGLAEDAGGRAAPELYRRKDRLESGIRWNRGRSAEVI